MRRRKAQEKVILADPKYNSKIIAKFMNMVMVDGKKSIAEKLVYSAFDIVLKNLNEEDILKVFYKALDNARPRLEVKPRRVGTYQVPSKSGERTSIALRWSGFARIKRQADAAKISRRNYRAYKVKEQD